MRAFARANPTSMPDDFPPDEACPNAPEGTHHWGKDHCTAGLQLDKTVFDQKIKSVVICML